MRLPRKFETAYNADRAQRAEDDQYLKELLADMACRPEFDYSQADLAVNKS